LPVLVRASVPTVLRRMPVKLLLALLSPTVRVLVPAEPAALPSTRPVPESPLIRWSKPFRSRRPTPVPELETVTLPAFAPVGIWLAAPRRRVAERPFVAPRLMMVSPA